MIRNDYTKQSELEVVTIDQLVPENHLLRKVERSFDFEFVRKRMEPLYSKDNGRPAIDPVVLFKMMFIGYMYGIRSERQLIKEIEVNIAYRWFLGMTLTEKVPHHSTISQNRCRRFAGVDVFRQIFEDIVLMAYQKGLIEGKTLFTDSTHLKANANNKKFTKEMVAANTKNYIEELDAAVTKDRKEHHKPALPPKDENTDEPTKQIKVSKTDPESGYLSRDGKPHGFYYLYHCTTDNKHNMITDVCVTSGNLQDNTVYVSRLEYHLKHLKFPVKEVGLDAGYHTAHICHSLAKRNIFGVISYRKLGGKKGLFRRRHFIYDAENDFYICPNLQVLKYSSTGRDGFRIYSAGKATCAGCPLLTRCTKNKDQMKTMTRHVWEEDIEQIKANRKTERGEHIKKRRSETIERSFADGKQLHGLRYARYRGLKRVEEQCLMTAIVQNIKKMVRMGFNREKGSYFGQKWFLRLIKIKTWCYLNFRFISITNWQNPLFAASYH